MVNSRKCLATSPLLIAFKILFNKTINDILVLYPLQKQTGDYIVHYLIKGNKTVYFSSSLYIINQKPMIPRTHFHCMPT